MSTFVNNNVASGNIVYASDHNTQGALVAAVLNGGIDDANINASAGIAGSKLADNGVTAAKTEELPLATQRQANATVTAITDPVHKFGWVQLTATVAKTQTYALTFGTAFDNVPIVTATIAGYKSAAATDVDAGSSLTVDCIACYAEAISTTGCTIRVISSGANLPNVAIVVCWTADGKKAR